MLIVTARPESGFPCASSDGCRWIEQAEPGPTWTGNELATPTLRSVHDKKWATGHYASRFVDTPQF